MLTVEQTKLIEENISLAYYFAHQWRAKFSHIYGDLDDLESLCFLALTKAARGYDPNKKIKFATFVGVCVRNEIFMVMRGMRKHKGKLTSLHGIFDLNNKKAMEEDTKDSSEWLLAASVDDGVDEFMDRELIEYMIDHLLTERERFVVYHRYFEGWMQKDCAKHFGLNQSYISRIERSALEKMRKYMKFKVVGEFDRFPEPKTRKRRREKDGFNVRATSANGDREKSRIARCVEKIRRSNREKVG